MPLLADRDADRPIYLEHLNYRGTCPDPDRYSAAVDRIVEDLAAGPVARLPEVFSRTRVTVPPLPPHFVSREGALAAPRQIVTGDRAERLVGLHGMGGLAKPSSHRRSATIRSFRQHSGRHHLADDRSRRRRAAGAAAGGRPLPGRLAQRVHDARAP